MAALLLGAALRIGWLLLCPNQPFSDQVIYHRAASALANGLGFVDEGGRPHGWWPVGYPAALAPFYRVLGDAPASGHWANVVFGLALIALAFALGRELFGARAGAMAALFVAVYPTFVLLTTVTASEALFMPLALLSSALLLRAAKRPERPLPYLIAGGAVIGLSAYVRAPGILLAAVYPAYALTTLRWTKALQHTLLIGAVAIAVLLPWGFRTQTHFGTFQMVSMNGGSNLWMGNHEGGDGSYSGVPLALQGGPLPAREKHLRDLAVQFILEHPGQYVVLCARRIVNTLRSDTIAAVWNEPGIQQRFGARALGPLKLLCTLGYFAGLGLLGYALLWRPRAFGAADLALGVALIVLAVPFVLIVGGNRYHVPLAPYVLVWAAGAYQRRRAAAAQPADAPATEGAPAWNEPTGIAASSGSAAGAKESVSVTARS